MKNYIQRGDTVTLAAPYSVSGGDVVVIGQVIGVAAYDALAGTPVETALTGVFELPGSGDIGSLVYWDATAKQATATAGSNVALGHVVAAGATAGTVRVRLLR